MRLELLAHINKVLGSSSNIESLQLRVNFDGLSISKLSRSTLWPNLSNFIDFSDLFLIGPYHGYNKPQSANEYMKDFVKEAKNLTLNGIPYENKIIKLSVSCIICVSLAKSLC